MSPLLVLSGILATLHAAVFHFFWGSTLRQFLIIWLAALLGFGIGQGIAATFAWHDILIGELHLLPASCVCWISMALVRHIKL